MNILYMKHRKMYCNTLILYPKFNFFHVCSAFFFKILMAKSFFFISLQQILCVLFISAYEFIHTTPDGRTAYVYQKKRI